MIGGLYGNLQPSVVGLARADNAPVTLCFNGETSTSSTRRRPAVRGDQPARAAHDAIVGNVDQIPSDRRHRRQLVVLPGMSMPASSSAATPSTVAWPRPPDAIPKSCGIGTAHMVARLPRRRLPRVGVVHGDAGLAGWGLRRHGSGCVSGAAVPDRSVRRNRRRPLRQHAPAFPAMRTFAPGAGPARRGRQQRRGRHAELRRRLHGLLTRIGRHPSPHPPLHEIRIAGAHVALLPVAYDTARWEGRLPRPMAFARLAGRRSPTMSASFAAGLSPRAGDRLFHPLSRASPRTSALPSTPWAPCWTGWLAAGLHCRRRRRDARRTGRPGICGQRLSGDARYARHRRPGAAADLQYGRCASPHRPKRSITSACRRSLRPIATLMACLVRARCSPRTPPLARLRARLPVVSFTRCCRPRWSSMSRAATVWPGTP